MRVSKLMMTGLLLLTTTLPIWAANPTSSSAATTHPIVHQINTRLRTQWMLIAQGLKSGKLTKDQAASLRASLKSTRLQEVSFFKQNGNHDLTTAQQTQLNTLLDKNSGTLAETVPSGE
jgi:hypothetical protein